MNKCAIVYFHVSDIQIKSIRHDPIDSRQSKILIRTQNAYEMYSFAGDIL